jgi:hypothetical protein
MGQGKAEVLAVAFAATSAAAGGPPLSLPGEEADAAGVETAAAAMESDSRRFRTAKFFGQGGSPPCRLPNIILAILFRIDVYRESDDLLLI